MNENKKKISVSYIIVLLAAAVLYIVSCAPGPLWQDSGMIQYRVWHNDIEGGLGLALSHPLFFILAIGAKYIPLGEFAHRVNLVSAIAAAVAVANLFLLLRLWLGRNLPAIIAAVTFALSHTFWRHACIAETYTLYIAILIAELIMLLQYVKTNRVGYLYLLGLFNGLSIADHMFGSIPLLCYAIFLIVLLARRGIRLRHLAGIILFWVIGAGLYEYLIIKNIIRTGDFTGTLASAIFGTGWQGAVLNISLSVKIVKENLLFLLFNFPTPNILLFFAGCFGLFKLSPRRDFKNVLLGIMVLFLIFAFRYTVPDRYAFFIPFYCILSIFIGLGAHLLQMRINHKVFAYLTLLFSLLPIPVYLAVPTLADKMRFSLGIRREIPYRNSYTYFLQPWKTGYHGAELFASKALESAENEAIIIADGTTVYALWYLQGVKGINTKVKVVSQHGNYKNPIPFPTMDTIEQLMADDTVYVVSPVEGYCPDYLLKHYDFIKTGPIYRVVARQ